MRLENEKQRGCPRGNGQKRNFSSSRVIRPVAGRSGEGGKDIDAQKSSDNNGPSRQWNVPGCGDYLQNQTRKMYGVPFYRYLSNDHTDLDVLIERVNKVSRHEFSLRRNDVQALAYNLAESLKIDHLFNTEEGLADWNWLWGFIQRNPGLSIRKKENLKLIRELGMERKVVYEYFDLLKEIMKNLIY
ncbi:hypothetical protein ILUMI_21442 [Ignelater luminosus]|uniref:Uncharacterized protein n=1 Tax=Ignelater luminosus TaxID=2038154 RepID=A0A8K0G3J9_IGNLU|nr:hypothetical protein ILUMI_21442 [Ignelater luminosus]